VGKREGGSAKEKKKGREKQKEGIEPSSEREESRKE